MKGPATANPLALPRRQSNTHSSHPATHPPPHPATAQAPPSPTRRVGHLLQLRLHLLYVFSYGLRDDREVLVKGAAGWVVKRGMREHGGVRVHVCGGEGRGRAWGRCGEWCWEGVARVEKDRNEEAGLEALRLDGWVVSRRAGSNGWPTALPAAARPPRATAPATVAAVATASLATTSPVSDIAQVAQQVGPQCKHLVAHHTPRPNLAQVCHLLPAV